MEEKQTVSCMEEKQDGADTTKPLGVGVEGKGALFAVNTANEDSKGQKEATGALAAILAGNTLLSLVGGGKWRNVLVEKQEEQKRKGDSLEDYIPKESVAAARKDERRTKGSKFCIFSQLCPGLCKSVTGIME